MQSLAAPEATLLALTPGAPAPYVTIRALAPGDVPALRRHFQALAKPLPDPSAPPPPSPLDTPADAAERMAAEALRAALAPDAAASLPGAIALSQGEIVALVLCLDDGPAGLGTAVTALPGWRRATLESLLDEVLADAAPCPALAEAQQMALAEFCCLVGGRLVRSGRLRLSAEPPPPLAPARPARSG